MFTLDATIDMIQNGKKQFISMTVTNKTIAECLNKFIDAQSEYTKNALKAGTDTMTILSQETMKSLKESTQFDYTKFGEGIMKAYQKNFKI